MMPQGRRRKPGIDVVAKINAPASGILLAAIAKPLKMARFSF
jgi:hypothetical protein